MQQLICHGKRCTVTSFFMGTTHLFRLLSLFTGISALQQARSWVISVPETVTAVEGSCVLVPCLTKPHSRVIWYQYHNIKYPVVYDGVHPETVENQFRGRTSVLGNAGEGNCTLRINDVKTSDNNLKVYVWINPDKKITQKFHAQTATIIVERRTPIISVQKQMVDGKFFMANCSIYYSCPRSPPSLHWTISPFLENPSLIAFNEKVQGQWLYRETLHGRATHEIHDSKMVCSAQFKTFTAQSRQITLNILYKPVAVTLMLEKEPIMEGGSVIMECASNSNPQPHTYSWLKRQMGRNSTISSTERKMTFDNITRDTSLSCVAHNDVGEGRSDWLDLDVQYAPVILPESSCRLTGEALKCVCRAEASPNASISWTVDGNDTVLSSFSLVSTIKTNVVSGVMSGPGQNQFNVSCTATNSLGSSTKQLSVHSFSKTSSVSAWLTAVMLLGTASLFGCVIYRKYFRNRTPPGFVCNTCTLPRPQSDNGQRQQIHNSPRTSRYEDSLSCRPDSNPEVDTPETVYDNDFVAEMQPIRPQRHQNNATNHQKEYRILTKVQ